MKRAAVAVALGLAAALPAAAQWDTKREVAISQTGPRQASGTFGSIMSPHVGYGSLTGGAGASATMTSLKTGPGAKPGLIIDVEVKRVLTQPKLARAILRNLPAIGTAITIAEVLNEARVAEGAGGTILMDPGTAQQTITQFCATIATPPGQGCGATRTEAVSNALALYNDRQLNVVYAACPKTGTWSCTLTEARAPSVPSSGFVTIERRTRNDTWQGQGTWTAWGFWQQISVQSSSAQGCPEGQQIAWWDTTKCTTLIQDWTVVDETIATPRIEPKLAQRPSATVAGELIGAGVPIEHEAPTLDPVPERYVDRELTRNPDGTVSVRDTIWTYIPGLGRYDWSPRIVEKDYPDEASVPPPGEIDGGTETEGTPPPVPVELLTCGLPGTPPCKIDETGTPTEVEADTQPIDDARDSVLDKIDDLAEVQAPGWTFTFSLPSSCSVVTIGEFAGAPFAVDVCQFQPQIHGIMTAVWALSTVWFCIGLVGRTFTGG